MSAEIEAPPLIEPRTRPPAAARVAVGLVLFGLLDLIHSIVTIVSAIKWGSTYNISLSPAFIPAWFAATLVWLDKRTIWPILAYASALILGSLIGGFAGCALGLPAKLVSTLAWSGSFQFGSIMGYFLAFGIFLIWLLLEAEGTRTLWRPAAKSTGKWLRPKACLVYSIAPTLLLTWGMLSLLLQGRWTEPAVQRARAEHGDGYDYLVTSYHFKSVNGRASYSAEVLAYNEKELKEIELQWTNESNPQAGLAH